MHIALVAGEASGDQLAAGLIRALRAQLPEARFSGLAGPAMRAAGCEAIEDIAALSVMGLAEVLVHLPRLLRLRARLARHYLNDTPDLFVGVDAPDFNLGLERRLKQAGIRTAHYVSPSVWAWRQGRVRTVHASCDLVLCLFPFEQDFYRAHGVAAEFVGHPFADEIAPDADHAAARQALGLPGDVPLLALLPGSRSAELKRHAPLFLTAARALAAQVPGLGVAVPCANPGTRAQFEAAHAAHAPALDVRVLDGGARAVLTAADAALVASGTATLEALLCGCPQVVAYRLSAFSHAILGRLVRTPYVALPNLLAGRALVPEFIQSRATPESLSTALHGWFEAPQRVVQLRADYRALHLALCRDASVQAARHLLALV
jgi:lipid-A-disaccharide synthase